MINLISLHTKSMFFKLTYMHQKVLSNYKLSLSFT